MTLYSDTSTWISEEHKLFSDSVRKFYANELSPKIEEWNEDGIVGRDFWRKAGSAGVMAGSVPEDFGGAGGDIGFDSIALYEQAKTGDGSWGYGIQSIVIHYLIAYGNTEQKLRWLPKLVTGEKVGALAMTEPSAGSDVQSIRTTAKKDGNQYSINGSKIFITNGQSADLIILTCKTDKDAGAKGVSLILIDTEDLAGFERGKNLKKLGLKGNDTSELFFKDTRVPLTNLLGSEEGQGFYQLMKQLPWERLLIGITALGSIDCALEKTIAYVQQRKAFGKRIMDFQNTRFKLAEVKTKAEVLRAFVNDCIYKLQANRLDAATASMAKWWGSQIQNEVMDECLQLHGGYGFMMEYPIARMYADARVQSIYGGTNEIMKELIARAIDKQ
ncbi:MAG: acyl-CoA dehydrogenase family protein [Pseudomonadota bacterium]|nr:acyl-CoA dehydrogenase family protein [Pseudomonadota bacterium]